MINDIAPKRLGNVYGEQFGTGYSGNIWDTDYISPTLLTFPGGVSPAITTCYLFNIREDEDTETEKEIKQR